jgi:hypothetical protein
MVGAGWDRTSDPYDVNVVLYEVRPMAVRAGMWHAGQGRTGAIHRGSHGSESRLHGNL